MIIKLSSRIIIFIIFLFMAHNANAEKIEYIYTDTSSQGMSAIMLDDGIMVYGPKMYMKFDNKFSTAHFTGPHNIKGYSQYIKSLSDGEAIIAGVNHNRRGIAQLFSTDSRQNFIAHLSPKSLRKPVKTFKNLNDRLSYGLEINKEGFPVVLSGSPRGNYTLTIFSKNLHSKKHSIKFGQGEKAGLAITKDGTYIVVGFDKSEYALEALPTYWEFSPDLQLLKKERLGFKSKSIGNGLTIMNTLTHENDAYAVYGWEQSGVKDEKPNEIYIKKIKGETLWQKEAELPYYVGANFFISPKGTPYALYARANKLEKISFAPNNGEKTIAILNRPTEPMKCFPPKWKYEVIDVLQDKNKNELIVFNGDPLNHSDAGCVTIGIIK